MMRDWLKRIRENQEITQRQLSLELDISESYYSLIENGERRPSPEVAQKIAAFLGGFEWTRFYTKEEADN
jgi:transcriptional regulator with XRE-family HTH domain